MAMTGCERFAAGFFVLGGARYYLPRKDPVYVIPVILMPSLGVTTMQVI
jgi:hypothetical protein